MTIHQQSSSSRFRIVYHAENLAAPFKITIIHNGSNGIAKFTPEEIYTLGKKDIEALATILSDKSEFFGDQLLLKML